MWRNVIPQDARAVVIVVSQDGCGACEDYLPRFTKLAAPYAATLPMIHLDAADMRPEAQAWMDQVKVESTPSTYVLRHNSIGGGVWRLEGSQDDATIEQTLKFASKL
jgi:thiol-disulfide isomerase/thioredoxin